MARYREPTREIDVVTFSEMAEFAKDKGPSFTYGWYPVSKDNGRFLVAIEDGVMMFSQDEVLVTSGCGEVYTMTSEKFHNLGYEKIEA